MFDNCKKADIMDKTGTLICQARVSAGRAGEALLIIPRSATYKPNTNYLVVFYDPVLGCVTCRCRLSVSVTLPGGELCSLRCMILEQLAQNQRRQDVKIPLGLNITIHATYQFDDPASSPALGVPATIVNISAGGVYLRTTLLMAKNRRFWFDFVETGEKMTLSAQVLRVEHASTTANQVLYGYGCKFVDMLSRDEASLRSYIFRKQRQQLGRG